MRIMECRHSQLESSLQGLDATNIPLVSLQNGTYFPGGYADDLGIYYFIPWIAKTFGISVDQAINVFFGSLLFLGAAISFFCFFFVFKHWSSRLVSSVGIGLSTYAAYRYADVYITPFFAVSAIVPIFVLWNEKSFKWIPLLFSLGFSGLIIGYSNIVRTHAGTGAFLFLITWLLLNKDLLKKEKLISTFILILFTALPYLHIKTLEIHRDQFLAKSNPSYEPISIVHPMWHSIYIGFGYLENPYGISYSDTVSYEKALSIDPKVFSCSSAYEQILKNECFLLTKNDPLFVMKTVLAKFFALLFKFMLFANFGLLFALFYIKPALRQIAPFILAALFYSLPGILVIPLNVYVSGLTSISTVFGIYMICLGDRKFRSEFSIQHA